VIKVTLEDTDTQTVTSDFTQDHFFTWPVTTVEIEAPPVPKTTTTVRTPLPGAPELRQTWFNSTQNTKSKVTTFEVEETISVPGNTCAEVLLIVGKESVMIQDVKAHLSIQAKGMRFATTGGIVREDVVLPGVVVEAAMKEVRFHGTYMETRATDTVYEIAGKLTTETGIQTSFIVNNIPCV